ncbi:MAG: SpoIID/LytB domain-containing protein, partial [Bacteroidales bacterium]|nr:SpoIID/LytB domain-containing protein [Bacteroidales bacterium]
EDYLLSVIASEMSAEAPLELLKAHAVISRSWVLRMKQGLSSSEGGALRADLPWERDYEKWYGGGSHRFYDVCADDHCQRYQGLTRLQGTALEKARLAVSRTAGQVLVQPDNRPDTECVICDTRFYKCCGGRTELFSTCWEEEDKPYLASVEDPYCAQATSEILAQVLNDYDVATRDWYQWEERCSREEISRLIAQKSGYDIGTLHYIKPLETGPSGRHKRIALCGDKRSLIVGKELEIRRLLSPSHLKSSAFEVSYEDAAGRPVELKIDEEGNLQTDWSRLVLRGKGWGHGVGLCQIGAAVMASQGFDYKQILAFYYPGSQLM